MATIRDVAREAGVSIATVSRVYNQTSLVSEGTAQHVRAVASRMDYWPNGAARSLITSRTQALGVLLPDLYGEFFSEVIRGIDLAARREGYQVLVSSSHSDSDALIAAVRAMRGRVDGLIAMAPDPASASVMRDFLRKFPVLLLDPSPEAGECCSISVASFEGAREMSRHLLSLGHRHIAFLQGPAGNVDADARLRGHRAALQEAGITPSPLLEVVGDFSESSGHHAALEILRMKPRPSAVFACNDNMALGLICALRDGDIRIPNDIAVTGFDDIAMARYLSPPLTTVRVDAYELGERAVKGLLPAVREGKPGIPRREVLATQLVVRASCGAREPHPDAMSSSRRRGRGVISQVERES